jgi:hypothetical protein
MGGLHKYSYSVTPYEIGGLIDVGGGTMKKSFMGIG